MSDSENTRRLVLAIIDFLQSQMTTRNDLSLEDRESLEIAMECLILAYDVENTDYIQRRPLLDMFMQVANPVSIENKQQAEAHKTSGNDKMEQELYNEAETEYSRAIELDKWNAMYYCNRASARIKMEQYFEAISDCRQALLLNPDYAKSYARMGQAYALMDRPRRAARCYRQALELDPDNERYRNNLTVAESQAAQQPNLGMENLISNIVSSIFLGGPQLPGGPGIPGGGPSFMIISDPHTGDQCTTSQSENETSESSMTDFNSAVENKNTEDKNKNTGDKNGGNETSERRGHDESLHLRVLLGIPVMSDEDDSSADSNSKNGQTTGQHNETEGKSKNGAQNSNDKEAQKKVEEKGENANNKNADDKSPQGVSAKIPENSKSDDKLKKTDADNSNSAIKSPHLESSSEQEKSNPGSNKNNIMSWLQESQSSVFEKVSNFVPYKKSSQEVNKDIESHKNNSYLPKEGKQQYNITEEMSKNDKHDSAHKENKNEVEVKGERAKNKNADDKSPQGKSLIIPENSKNENKLKNRDTVSSNSNIKSLPQDSSKEQEKSNPESNKNNLLNWKQGSQNSLFGKVNASVPYKKQPENKDIERQRNNPNLTNAEEKGQSCTSQRNNTFKNPEGDAKQPQQPFGISMTDIANFFRNMTRSDQENANEHNDSQLTQSSSNKVEKGNDKDKHPQGHASTSPGNQSSKLPLPENKPSKEKEDQTKTENEASSCDAKPGTDEKSGANKKSKADEEKNKK